MTNAFNDYTADASMHGKNAYGVNGYSDANQYDIRVFDTYNGYKCIGLKNLKGTLYSGTIYLKGTPKGTYSGRYSTLRSNPTYFGYAQKWELKNWSLSWHEHSNYTSMMKGKPTSASAQHDGYNEVFWDVEIYDKSPLNLTINSAEKNYPSSLSSSYTSSSWNTLQNAITTAKPLLSTREVTQTQLDGAKAAIEKAIEDLVPVYTVTWYHKSSAACAAERVHAQSVTK